MTWGRSSKALVAYLRAATNRTELLVDTVGRHIADERGIALSGDFA